jgi:hypothetical protein
LANQKQQGAAVSSYLLHSSLAGVKLFFAASANCAKMLCQNHFAEPNQHALTSLHPISICRVKY